MTAAAEYRDLPFEEAIDFFRKKKLVPTRRWDDLLRGDHDHGFMVAGAMKNQLLQDFYNSVRAALEDGETKADFQKRFDAIVKKHGWSYNGGRTWRSDLIYSTNLSTAYHAGRWQQMTDPDVVAYRPYWVYRHSDNVQNPRPEHQAWDGKVLPANHDWWKTHYPQNGWGCQCSVDALSQRDLERQGLKVSRTPPTPPGDTSGIDRGFEYAPGRSMTPATAYDALAKGSGRRDEQWEILSDGDWKSRRRPEEIPRAPTRAALATTPKNQNEALAIVRKAIGGDDRVFRVGADEVAFPVRINAEALTEHLMATPDRFRFAPLLPELFADPFEAWMGFERLRPSSAELAEIQGRRASAIRAELSFRVIRRFDLGGRMILAVARIGADAQLEAVTFIATNDAKYINRQRWGRLLVAK